MDKFFFCGIGGSGMLPLALILKAQGVDIVGSDRAHDALRTPEKFSYIINQGIKIVPQDGNGLDNSFTALVVSSAIEDSIPEVKRAREIGVPILKRAELLAQIFNTAKVSIAVGGTSGKSTTTGMIALILHEYGKNPTVMNGASFLNFVSKENPYATALMGDKDLFVAECDESDGSIVLYKPSIAVLNNIALDHKPISELIPIFNQYINNSSQVILNITNNAVKDAFFNKYKGQGLCVAINDIDADIVATNITPTPYGSTAEIKDLRTGEGGKLSLSIIGKHNVENAICAIGAVVAAGVPILDAINILSNFKGVSRRLQTIKNINNINVLDDFAHNPDKISASLTALHEYDGRLIVMFQMHGYAPLRLMREELIKVFTSKLHENDVFYMPDVLYMGGTVDKSYGSAEFIAELNKNGVKNAHYVPNRADIAQIIRKNARSGDRIVIMGARDDTLPEFAHSIL